METKNARIGDGAKVPHQSYVGDAEIGRDVNIGAGVIFANYDGVTKSTTVVGDYSFVGSNSVLAAPLVVGRRRVRRRGIDHHRRRRSR